MPFALIYISNIIVIIVLISTSVIKFQIKKKNRSGSFSNAILDPIDEVLNAARLTVDRRSPTMLMFERGNKYVKGIFNERKTDARKNDETRISEE